VSERLVTTYKNDPSHRNFVINCRLKWRPILFLVVPVIAKSLVPLCLIWWYLAAPSLCTEKLVQHISFFLRSLQVKSSLGTGSWRNCAFAAKRTASVQLFPWKQYQFLIAICTERPPTPDTRINAWILFSLHGLEQWRSIVDGAAGSFHGS
jgi:hypothetical protein